MVPCSFGSIAVRRAHLGDLPVAGRMMAPFVARRELLARSEGEMWNLLPRSYLAEVDGEAVGFAALEIYSTKLSEIQCLSYLETEHAPQIIGALLGVCLERAREHRILEVMAVVPAHLESEFIDCGFHIVLPGQKKAMFIRTGCLAVAQAIGCQVSNVVRATIGSPVFTGKTPDLPDITILRSNKPATQTPLDDVIIRPASVDDTQGIARFLSPFVGRGELLPRTEEELLTLLRHGFVAEARGRIVGFTALEVYSEKLAEVQCISVDEAYRGRGIGRHLVTLCVNLARDLHIAETMAITAREEVLRACGFDDCLPGAKIALFVRNR